MRLEFLISSMVLKFSKCKEIIPFRPGSFMDFRFKRIIAKII